MSRALPSATRPITGKMVLIWIVAFFAVIVAVNLTFVYFALDSWPGLTTQKAYEEGIAYNQTLEGAARQDAMGWRSHVVLGAATPKGTRMLTLTMTGPDGVLAGLAAQARLTRPLGEGLTVDVTLAEDRPGLYAALLRLPALGRWQAEVTARAPDGRAYRMVHEVQTGGTK